MKWCDGVALLPELYSALHYGAQSLRYNPDEGVHDLSMSADFLSDSDSSLSRDKSGPCKDRCSVSLEPGGKDQLQGNLESE